MAIEIRQALLAEDETTHLQKAIDIHEDVPAHYDGRSQSLGSRYNDLAWMLATHSAPQIRDAQEAVRLANRANELLPNNRLIINTLAVSEYRCGNTENAIELFNRSMELADGGDANDWFFLAMAHWQQGEADEAREWYRKAVVWAREKAQGNDEVLRFWKEAAELLGEEPPEEQRTDGEQHSADNRVNLGRNRQVKY